MTLPKYDRPIPPPPYRLVLYDKFGNQIYKAKVEMPPPVELPDIMPERFPKPVFKRFDSFAADYLIALSVCVIIAVIVFAIR